MNFIFLVMAAVFLLTACQAIPPVPKLVGNQYGYVNSQQTLVIPPSFHDASQFSHGYATIVQNGLYGFIDHQGKVVIAPQYTHASDFNQAGYAIVRDEWDKSHIINRRNEKILGDAYDYLWFFYDYIRFRQGNAHGLLNKQLQQIITSDRFFVREIINDDYFIVMDIENDSKYNRGIMDKSGKFILAPIYHLVGRTKSNAIIVEKDEHYGMVNLKGEFILPMQYDKINNAHSYPIHFVKTDGQWGAVDDTGRFVIQPQFRDVDSFNQYGIAAANQHGTYSLINTKGEQINQNQYQSIYIADDFIRANRGDTYFFIDAQTGEELTSLKATTVSDFSHGYATVKQDDQVIGVLDTHLSLTHLPDGYHSMGHFNSNQYTSIQKDKRYGLVDRSGKIIIEPSYDWLSYHHNAGGADLVIAQQRGKRFIINLQEHTILDGKFSYINAIGNNLYAVEVNQKQGIIRLDGSYLIPAEFDRIDSEKGFYIVKKDGLYGLINSDGQMIAPPIYDALSARFYVELNGKHNRLNRQGEYLYPQFYDRIQRQGNIDIVELNNQYGMYHFGRPVLAVEYDQIEPVFDDRNLFIIRKGEQFGLYKQTEAILPLTYDSITPVQIADHNATADESSEGYGNIKLVTTATIIMMGRNNNLTNAYQNELLLISQHGKYGLISADLKQYIKPQFDALEVIHRDRYKVRIGNQYTLINHQLEPLLPTTYDKLDAFDGAFIAQKDGRFGVITPNEILLDFVYDQIEPTLQGLVITQQNNQFGIADIRNNQQIKPSYEHIAFIAANDTDHGNAWWKNEPHLILTNGREQQSLIYNSSEAEDVAFQITTQLQHQLLEEEKQRQSIHLSSGLSGTMTLQQHRYAGHTNYHLHIDDQHANTTTAAPLIDHQLSLMHNRHQSIHLNIKATSFNQLYASFGFQIRDGDQQSLIIILEDDASSTDYQLHFDYHPTTKQLLLSHVYAMQYEYRRYGKGELEAVYLVDSSWLNRQDLAQLNANAVFDYLFYIDHAAEEASGDYRVRALKNRFD